ncbi:MAG TPA: LPXTG cell wall anchor domain-containing protein [Cyclobacteriaceae bacterium]|jgi:LPXTG-motif cell wall-anchored protein|nr:LPXTG cell wall anchor domain-containing protein [Cyclobacteriaceae bacterium]
MRRLSISDCAQATEQAKIPQTNTKQVSFILIAGLQVTLVALGGMVLPESACKVAFFWNLFPVTFYESKEFC